MFPCSCASCVSGGAAPPPRIRLCGLRLSFSGLLCGGAGGAAASCLCGALPACPMVLCVVLFLLVARVLLLLRVLCWWRCCLPPPAVALLASACAVSLTVPVLCPACSPCVVVFRAVSSGGVCSLLVIRLLLVVLPDPPSRSSPLWVVEILVAASRFVFCLCSFFVLFCRSCFLSRGPPACCVVLPVVCVLLCCAVLACCCCLVSWFSVLSRCLQSCLLLAPPDFFIGCCVPCPFLLSFVWGALCPAALVSRCLVLCWAVVLSFVGVRCAVFRGALPRRSGLFPYCGVPPCAVFCCSFCCCVTVVQCPASCPGAVSLGVVWACPVALLFLLVLCLLARLVRCCGALCCFVSSCVVVCYLLAAGWCLVLVNVFAGSVVGLVAWCCLLVVCFGIGVLVWPRCPSPCRWAPWLGSLWRPVPRCCVLWCCGAVRWCAVGLSSPAFVAAGVCSCSLL